MAASIFCRTSSLRRWISAGGQLFAACRAKQVAPDGGRAGELGEVHAVCGLHGGFEGVDRAEQIRGCVHHAGRVERHRQRPHVQTVQLVKELPQLPAPRPNGTLRALGPRADRSRRLRYNSLSLTPASPSRGERPSWTQRPVSIPTPSRLLRPSSCLHQADRSGGIGEHRDVDAEFVRQAVEARERRV